MPEKNIKSALLACCLMLPGLAHAETADRDKPIRVIADSATASQKDKNNKTTLLERNVKFIQGTLEVNADRATINEDAAGNQVIVATGSPVTFRQKLDGEEGWMDGKSDKLVYNTSKNEARLIGHAWLKKATDEARGEEIVYNTEAANWTVTGGPASGTKDGKVVFDIFPKKKPAALPSVPAVEAPLPVKTAP